MAHEAGKKKAARERNYKEAQRLRDLVTQMKSECESIMSEVDELEIQLKEEEDRVSVVCCLLFIVHHISLLSPYFLAL